MTFHLEDGAEEPHQKDLKGGKWFLLPFKTL
jgi:hypothetical protein